MEERENHGDKDCGKNCYCEKYWSWFGVDQYSDVEHDEANKREGDQREQGQP